MSTPVSTIDPCLSVDVAEQLERILSNELFASSECSSRFLRYVVEQTLAGRAGGIKELVIAVELYVRAAGYDPKVDSTVRVEAGRLRAKLQRYYALNGVSDPVRITIPKGGYVPQFERVEPAAPAIDAPPPASMERARALVEIGERPRTRPIVLQRRYSTA